MDEGIPGSVGGGLRMNAGPWAFRLSIRWCGCVISIVKAWRTKGRPRNWRCTTATSRRSRKTLPVSAVFRGERSSIQEIVRRLDASQEKRRTTQPAAKSAGCIFKNPNGCPAGKLVDELGLKGWQWAALESQRCTEILS